MIVVEPSSVTWLGESYPCYRALISYQDDSQALFTQATIERIVGEKIPSGHSPPLYTCVRKVDHLAGHTTMWSARQLLDLLHLMSETPRVLELKDFLTSWFPDKDLTCVQRAVTTVCGWEVDCFADKDGNHYFEYALADAITDTDWTHFDMEECKFIPRGLPNHWQIVFNPVSSVIYGTTVY